ncbi:MAG: hypothetical protein E7261_11775 [Lachnospiraceae bacterium]|nr:hypothetical protein [Lachnospiraceae bacterium]
MKKYVMAIVSIILLTCMACGKQENGESVTSTFPADEENTTTTEIIIQPTTSVTETTMDPGIMPNTAGIVVKATTTAKETTTAEIPDDERGIGDLADNNIRLADEDAARLGVSKVLVLQTISNCTWNTGEDIINKFNELLVTKYGCDFVVGFIGANPEVDEKGYTYYHFLEDIRNLGQQADIIMSGAPAHYTRLVEDGFLLDITEYLGSEEGEKLYDAYSEEVWELVRVEGRIYGYVPRKLPSYVNALSCNREMAEKLGLNIEAGYSFYDIGNMLEAVENLKEDIAEKVILYSDSGYLEGMLGYYNMGRGIYAKKNEDGSWTAFNATENEEFINLWKKVREYKEKGWLRTDETAYDAVEEGDFLFAAIQHYYSDRAIEDKLVMVVGKGPYAHKTVYEVIPGEWFYSYYTGVEDFVYGVTTWSKYRQEALELITLINTEPELANLLVYGIENKHYSYKDKLVRTLPTSDGIAMGDGDMYVFVNPGLLLAQCAEPENKAEYYKEVAAKFEASPLCEYGVSQLEFFEFLEDYEQRSTLHQIYAQGYEKLFNGDYEDVEAAVAEINRMQKEAGIDELIDAFNTQMFIKDVE